MTQIKLGRSGWKGFPAGRVLNVGPEGISRGQADILVNRRKLATFVEDGQELQTLVPVSPGLSQMIAAVTKRRKGN